MEGNNSHQKYTLFSDNGGLQAKLYDSDRDQSPPKPQSARGESRSKVRSRPTSAQSARVSTASGGRSRRYLSPNDRESRSVGGTVMAAARKRDGVDEAYYQLEREDLLNTCLELKKNQKITEAEIAKLKYENQRLETENLKSQRRIEKLISPHTAKNGQTTTEIRREIEKSAIVRQLKGQIQELRELLLSKDKLLDTMQKSQKASQLLELMAEKEEYFAEVQRLKSSLKTRDEEIQRLHSRGGAAGANYRGSLIEDELRTEINRLSDGYNQLLTRLAQSEKDRQLDRIAAEEANMQHEAHTPDEPGPSRGSKRSGGGRNQVKKTYSQPQPEVRNAKSKRPSSASATGRSGRGRGTQRGRSRDPSPGNRRQSEENFPDAVANDEWLSMTFGSGSVEPLPAQPPSLRGDHNTSPTKESGRPVTSRRGDPQLAEGDAVQQGTLSALNFSVGDRVSCAPSGSVGIVKSVDLLDMVCDVTLDSGEEIRGIPTAEITLISPRRKNRALKEAQSVDTTALVTIDAFKTSDKVNLVMANSKRPGTVIKHQRADNLYDVMLDKGGEIMYNIPAKCLELRQRSSPKKVKPSAESALPPLLNIGTPVNARYKGSDYWYPGVIREIEPGANSYVIHFDDGEIVTGVATDHVDPRDVNAPQDPATNGLQLNTHVEANYLNKGKWYPGRVSLSRGGGTYDIAFDDGEHEQGVTLDRLRINGVVLAPPPDVTPTSNVVEATQPLSETPPAVNDPQTATLEEHISPQPSKKPVSPRRAQPYSEGDDVEIEQSGSWVAGRVARIYLRGYEVVYDVQFDSGSVTEGVGHDHIRHRTGGQNNCSHYFKLEAQVEVFDTTLASWRLGTVKSLNSNGSYDIMFTNNETHRNVLASYVRVVPDEDSGEKAAPAEGPAVISHKPTPVILRKHPELVVGSKIDGNFGGEGNWFPGEIVKEYPDGSVDIAYTDGDLENGVNRDNIRPPTISVDADTVGKETPRAEVVLTKDTTPLPTEPPPLAKGSKVEANYRCQGKWYPGEIIREHPDDTVDVDYDDGERETRIKRENVRLLTPKDDLMDYLAGLSDEDEDDDKGALDYGIGGGGVVYENSEPVVGLKRQGSAVGSEDNDYAEDFD